MKIRTGTLKTGDVICTYQVKIWTAASWDLTNKSLAQALRDKAYESAGVKPGLLYTESVTVRGGVGGKKEEAPDAWSFEVVIKRKGWEEVTE